MTHAFFSHAAKTSAMMKNAAVAHNIVPRVRRANAMTISRAMPVYTPICSRTSDAPGR